MANINTLNPDEAQSKPSSDSSPQDERLGAILALARLAAHEINQPLAVLQNEIQLMELLGTTPDPLTLQLMLESVSRIAERLKAYQQLTSCRIIETLPGVNVLESGSATQRPLAG
jgi:signal transduction histidine kinase